NINENEGKLKKENSEDLEDHLTQEKGYYKEKSSIEHETIEVFSDENSKEDSQEHVRNSHKKYKNSSKEIVSYKEEKTKKLNDEGEEESKESQEYSTIKSEEINSEEYSTEYQESTEAFYGSTYEDPEDDYTESGSFEDTTLSSERFYSEEEHESSLSDQEDSTEGVLKFTDELPKEKKEDTLENGKSSDSDESMVHDYVDDNYEPENYKERESSDSNSLSDEKINKEMMADGRTEEHEKPVENIGKNETTESPKSVRIRTTTTVRPTPPKLFKPIAVRKNYNYIPPTTTPNPVVIKPRLSLLNPKPAKPPKSYNELVPKPVIRKFPLLSRKPTTTMSTTTKEEDFTETTEVITTEAITTTEASRSEENVLEGKLESTNDSQSIINSDLVQESHLKPINDSEHEYQLEMKSETKSNDSEQSNEKLSDNSEQNDQSKPDSDSKDEDQKLESEQEMKSKSHNESEYKIVDLKQEHETPIKSEDQDTSSNEQKSSTNTEKEEAFTPYPISKLSTLASSIEKALKETTSTESEKSTTIKSSTLIDVELISTTIPPTTLTTTDQPLELSTIKETTEEAETVQTSTTPF
ncbi:endochitinase A-like, partial [Ceratina calcarata]